MPFETGKFSGQMAVYAQMRVNPAKSVGFSAVEAAAKIKTPMLIIDAGKEELMDIKQNGQRVAGILQANGTPVDYHVIEDTTHYGIYKEKFVEITAMEVEWLDKHLKTLADKPAANPSVQ